MHHHSQFQVLDVQLRRVTYAVNIPSKGSTVVLQGFIKDYPALDAPYPTQIAVLGASCHHCLVEVLQIAINKLARLNTT